MSPYVDAKVVNETSVLGWYSPNISFSLSYTSCFKFNAFVLSPKFPYDVARLFNVINVKG